jgi:hypothetical protein
MNEEEKNAIAWVSFSSRKEHGTKPVSLVDDFTALESLKGLEGVIKSGRVHDTGWALIEWRSN